MTQLYPAPWDLRGDGYIVPFRIPGECATRLHFMPSDFDHGRPRVGAMMIVDYQESTAGPYRELLFATGPFKYKKKSYSSITKIYVSTETSVINGRKNWGIPKELADFHITTIDSRRERIMVKKGNLTILDVVFKKWWFPIRISTKVFPTPIMQILDGTRFFTKFTGSGKKRHAKIESLFVNEDHFPDVTLCKPLMPLRIEDFSIRFPVAETEEV